MHIRTSEKELSALFSHKVGASLFVGAPGADATAGDVVVALMLATNAGWLPVYPGFTLTVEALYALDAGAIRVSEIAG